MAGSAATGFKVLTSEGQTCASAGLTAIASAAECQQAITAVNAADGEKDYGSVRTQDYSFGPSGCYAGCNTDYTGYFCGYFNTATTAHGVGSSAKGIFCNASSSGMCYSRTCSQIARILDGAVPSYCSLTKLTIPSNRSIFSAQLQKQLQLQLHDHHCLLLCAHAHARKRCGGLILLMVLCG